MKVTLDLGVFRRQALDAVARAERKSRSSIIREAIDDHLAWRGDEARKDAFGLWGDREVDGLDDQRKIRRSW